MCVCFCTFFIKVHDPSLRLTPQNPHSRKSRAKKFLISKFCFYLHLHIAIPCFDGQMEEAFLLESSTFETMTTISWDAHPQLGLTPQTEPPATALSKRARLIAIPRITAVRVNCWCPLEFDICQSLAIVGGRLLADVFVFWGIFHEEIMISLRWLITYFVVNSVGILLKCPC